MTTGYLLGERISNAICVALPLELKEVWFGLSLYVLLPMPSSFLALVLMFVVSCLRTLRNLCPTRQADPTYGVWTTLQGCLNTGTKTRHGDGKDRAMAILIQVSCLTASCSLKGWSHHPFVLALRHFLTKFSKLNQQNKSLGCNSIF